MSLNFAAHELQAKCDFETSSSEFKIFNTDFPLESIGSENVGGIGVMGTSLGQ